MLLLNRNNGFVDIAPISIIDNDSTQTEITVRSITLLRFATIVDISKIHQTSKGVEIYRYSLLPLGRLPS